MTTTKTLPDRALGSRGRLPRLALDCSNCMFTACIAIRIIVAAGPRPAHASPFLIKHRHNSMFRQCSPCMIDAAGLQGSEAEGHLCAPPYRTVPDPTPDARPAPDQEPYAARHVARNMEASVKNGSARISSAGCRGISGVAPTGPHLR